MKITILCENSVKFGFPVVGEHGFSCFIEHENGNYLFDTGKGIGITDNAIALKKDLSTIKAIILSHGHGDHTGGLEKLLTCLGRKIKIYGHPDIFMEKYADITGEKKYAGIKLTKAYLESLGADFILHKDFACIAKGIYMTGEVPQYNTFETIDNRLFAVDNSGKVLRPDPLRDDNSLVIETDKGLVIILGCAHRGLVNVMEYVSEKFRGKNIYAVIGGTHLISADKDRLKKTITALKEFDVQLIATSHCTGLEKAAILANEFKEKFVFASAGHEFSI